MSRLFAQLRLRLRSMFNRKKVDQELEEELQFHLDHQIDEAVAGGLTPDEARFAALQAMGPITQNKEKRRDLRAANWIEDWAQDLRFGARTLRKNSTFTIVAVLALALGIGAAEVMRMVIGQGALLAALGLAIGLAGALALTRLLDSMLFGVRPTDALTFAAAPLGIILVVVLATVVPAFRATRISPVIALRYE